MKIRPPLSIESNPVLWLSVVHQLRSFWTRQIGVEFLTVIADRRVPQREETELPPTVPGYAGKLHSGRPNHTQLL